MAKRGRKPASELPDGPFCGAKSKRTGKPCTNQPMDNGRCRLHGGKSRPAGPTHQAFKTGRYSKYLPPAIAARVNEAANNPDLLSIRGSIELFDARLTQLLERVATGESGSLWGRLKDARGEFIGAQQEIQRLGGELTAIPPDDPRAEQKTNRIQDQLAAQKRLASDAMIAMGKLIDQGEKDEGVWREIQNLAHELASLQRAEVQTQVQLRQVLTAEDALFLVHQMQLAVIEEVADPETRVKIARRLVPLLGRAGPTAPAGVIVESPPAPATLADSHGPAR